MLIAPTTMHHEKETQVMATHKLVISVVSGPIPGQIDTIIAMPTALSAKTQARCLSLICDELTRSIRSRKMCPMRAAVSAIVPTPLNTLLANIDCTITEIESGSNHLNTRIALHTDDWVVGYRAIVAARDHLMPYAIVS